METLRQICSARIKSLLSPNDFEQQNLSGEKVVECIVRIISQNFASDRIRRVTNIKFATSTGKGKSVIDTQAQFTRVAFDNSISDAHFRAYVDQVIGVYLKEHERVEKLRCQNHTEWIDLFNRLSKLAYRALLRQYIAPARARDESLDFAQETCYVVYRSSFPYDVPFDAWVAKILNNLILKRFTRSRDFIDRKAKDVLSLDYLYYRDDTNAPSTLYNFLVDQSVPSVFEQIEVQEWLVQAILRLHSYPQQQVIIYTYFYDWADEDIARYIGKSRNAVHILRHRALLGLQKILKEEMKEMAL